MNYEDRENSLLVSKVVGNMHEPCRSQLCAVSKLSIFELILRRTKLEYTFCCQQDILHLHVPLQNQKINFQIRVLQNCTGE